MVATQTTPSLYPTPSATPVATIEELALRLERGWNLIEQRVQNGEPTDTYELHWFQLLSKYESKFNGRS